MQQVLLLGGATSAGRGRGASAPRSASTSSMKLLVVSAIWSLAAAVGAAADPLPRTNIVVHGLSGDRATAIRDHAEWIRSRAFARLLGDDAPHPWLARCEIHVHPTAAAFATAVGGAPDVARGATTIEFAGEVVSLRRIDVLDGAGPIPDSLAHELVHVVLADRFTAGPPPRWADEGLAVLFDAPEKQRAHDEDFRVARKHGLAWKAVDLLALEEYPEGSRWQRVFYGQSAALVRWLIAQRDAPTFIRFLEDCPQRGIREALERHYKLRSVEDLELAWREVPAQEMLSLAERSP